MKSTLQLSPIFLTHYDSNIARFSEVSEGLSGGITYALSPIPGKGENNLGLKVAKDMTH